MGDRIILASKSPRRIEMLERLNIKFEVFVSDVDESFDETLPPNEIVMEIAKKKAQSYKGSENDIVIGCDTMVLCKGEILGKPRDKEDARRVITLLSGKSHSVFSGIAICKGGDKVALDYCETVVHFRELSDAEIEKYISLSEPYDKAGGYGIQGVGGLFVTKIDGCYNNVVGMPLEKVYTLLKKEFSLDLMV